MSDNKRSLSTQTAAVISVPADDVGLDERRQHLVEAAIAAIEAEGPHVGMGPIAERAGLLRPNVYRQFASKEQLDAEVVRLAAADLIARVRPSFTQEGTPEQVIRGVIEPCVTWASEHPNLYRFVAAQQQTKKLHGTRMGRTRFLSELVAASHAYLRSAQPPPDREPPDGALAGLMGMVDSSIIWWLDYHDETQRELTDRLVRQVMAVVDEIFTSLGLSVPPGSIFKPVP